jgi:hypothetical protein
MSDIIKAAARVLSQTDDPGDDSTLWEDRTPEAERVLRAVTPLIRADALEEAAKVAEEVSSGQTATRNKIALRIRALISPRPSPTDDSA